MANSSDEADVAAGVLSHKKNAADKDKDKPTTLTKRQRRKMVNDKHKWPQMPKIQNPETRASAYVRVAGLGEKTKAATKAKNNKSLPDTVPPVPALNDPAVRFGRLLGSADQRVRHQAVLHLESYLKQKSAIDMKNENENDNDDNNDDHYNNADNGLSEMDLLKLWKALWHTLYMADKVPVQEELSKRLAKLIWCVAGTEEEDEYAAQVYLEMYGDDAVGFDEDDDDDDDDDEEDDEDYTIEEIINTLEDDDDDDDDEKEEEEEEEEDESEEESGEEELVGEHDDHSMEDEDQEIDEEEQEVDEEGLDDSEIPHCRGAHLAALLVRTFFRTIRREWGRMDKYRVDKFYTLMRLTVHEIYRYMSLRHWSTGITRIFNDVLHEEILRQTPNGLRYHLIDLTLEELARVNAQAPMPLTEATFLECLEPYFAMASVDIGDDTVKARVMENIIVKFLEECSVVSESPAKDTSSDGKDKKDGGKPLTMDQVHVGTVAEYLFKLASDVDTPDKDREALYDMHKRYMKAIKKAGKDVDLQAEPENVWDDDDDEDKNFTCMDCDDGKEEKAQEKDGEKKEKKEKSKKKKKKNKKEEPSTKAEAVEKECFEQQKYDGDVDTPERPRKRKLVGDETTDSAKDEVKEEESNGAGDSKKKKRKKKKKKSKDSEDDETEKTESPSQKGTQTPVPQKAMVEEEEGKGEVADAEIENSKGKKKKKKKKSKAEPSAASSSDDADRKEPEKITISVADQKAARKAMKDSSESASSSKKDTASSKKDKKKESKKEVAERERKRVKFGSQNMARSWKASMKGLRTLTEVSPLPKPDKGILHNKDRVKKAKQIRARPKASEYF